MFSYLPVASICTESRLREFLVTKQTLELFHPCKWVVATDRPAFEYLSRRYPDDVWLLLLDREGSHIREQFQDFMHVAMQKMSMMRECIGRHGASLFVDSDLFFIGPINLQTLGSAPVVASNHHITEQDVIDKFGLFNVGMIYTTDCEFLNYWERITLERLDKCGLEQKPFEWALKETGISFKEFDSGHNVGWWRLRHNPGFLDTLGIGPDGRISAGGYPIVNFHYHLDPSIMRPEEAPFHHLVRQLIERAGSSQQKEALRLADSIFASPR